MEFRTKIIVTRRNKRAYVAYAGLFIAASSLVLVFIPSLGYYIPYIFGTGIAVVIIGALIARWVV
jgi:drug/metabolite transporter superfamily protein YnfA